MAVNNYLITGITPANNEMNVALGTTITLTFAKDMLKDSLNDKNITLKKVNGDVVPTTLTYVNTTKKLVIAPSSSMLGSPGTLESGTVYELHVVGGTDGVKSIVGDYLGASKVYTFTTGYEAALTEPTNLKVGIQDGYLTPSWEPPVAQDAGVTLQYEVKVSSSAKTPTDDPGAVIWPIPTDISITTALSLAVPKKFAVGNYYVYIRAIDKEKISAWTVKQVAVVAPPVDPGTPVDPVDPNPNPGGGYFEVYETYPKKDAVHVTPDKIFVLLNDAVDETTVDSKSFYVLKVPAPNRKLTTLDLMTQYSDAKQVEGTLDFTTASNIVTFTPKEPLLKNEEYTIILKGSVKSKAGNALGEMYTWSFNTVFDPFFGDPELIRSDIGMYIRNLPDKLLYKQMHVASKFAYEINSALASFDPSWYKDGIAPYYMHEYVRYQVRYDLLLNAYMQQNNGMGSNVKLGDLAIEKIAAQGVDLTNIIRTYRDTIKPWLDMVHGQHNRGYAKPVQVVKGETGAAYPDFFTREFKELGQ